MSTASENKASANKRAEINGLIGVSVAALLGLVCALVAGNAPLTHYVSDWANWTRLSPLYAALAVFALILALLSALAALLFFAKNKRRQHRASLRSLSSDPEAPAGASGLFFNEEERQNAPTEPEANPVHAISSVSTDAPVVADIAEEAVTEAAHLQSASDAESGSEPILSEPDVEVPAVPAEEDAVKTDSVTDEDVSAGATDAANDDTESASEDVVAEIEEAVQSVPLQETAETLSSDENDPTHSLMAFAESAAGTQEKAPVSDETTLATPTETAAPPLSEADQATEVALAVQTALSVWPDSTRGVAAKEVAERIASLYVNKSEATQTAFQQIASGDLNLATSTLSDHADTLAQDGKSEEAANIWRAVGALFLGRDDGRALNAYAHVSELDAQDGNIHLFLARRYIHSGDLSKLPAVAERALAVIGEAPVRAELLAPYAEEMLKKGDIGRAAGALEELKTYKQQESEAHPDDLNARSTYAVSLAQLAQAYEKLGGAQAAGGLYRRAYDVFNELTQRLPEHAGLKAMAESALNDAVRLNA